MRERQDGAGPGEADSTPGPAPVASLDRIGDGDDAEPGSTGVAPVALFGADQVGAARTDVQVADLGASPARRPRRRSRAGAEGTPDPAERPARWLRAVPEDAAGSTAGEGQLAPSKRSRPARSQPRRWGQEPDADPVSAARAICLRLLTERARSRHELATALRRKGVPDEVAGIVLERFGEVGLINDVEFAAQWVTSRHTNKGLGRRALAVELRGKGVPDELAAEALQEIDSATEELRARQLVDRKLRGATLDSPEQRATAARRLAGMLARKGYGAGVAYRVVREALVHHGAPHDELGPADEPD